MVLLEIPQFTACRWMVSDLSGPIRAFPTKMQAEAFISNDNSYVIRKIPQKVKTYIVEEAPF